MKIGSRNNRELDRIGDAILSADRLREDEIEQIASAPHLLAGIRARIDAGSSRDFAKHERQASIARPWLVYPATAALAMLFAVLVMLSGRGKVKEDVFLVAPPDEIENPGPSVITPPIQPQEQPATTSESRRKVRDAVPVEASVREPRAKRPSVKKKGTNAPLEFYALSSAGDPADMFKDGRIIRVDLPRTSLLSLGVNVPLESETAVVKTDLLVGSDGVTRAIRVVK